MSDIDQLMMECYLHSDVFGKTFYPDRFSRPFDPIHQEIFSLIDGSKSNYIALAAPRGIGKTSIANLLLTTKKALFHEARYIVPVSCSSSLAMQQSENLKMKLTQNELIRALFGDVTVGDVETKVGRTTFSKLQWTINVGGKQVCIMPRGAGQQIRGLLWGDFRPDYIIVDDLEDPENMDNEEQRKKKADWFFGDLMGCVDPGSKDFKIVVVGTVLHQDSLLVNLLDDPLWDSKRLELCDDDFRSNAPHVKTDAECRELYERYKSQEKVHVFFREFRNIAVPTGDDAVFQRKFFQYYTQTEQELAANADVENIVIVDIAKTANVNSAESAVVGVGVNINTNAIYVRDIRHGKFHPDKLLDEIVDCAVQLRARYIGVEVTGLHEFITYPLKNHLVRQGLHHIEVIELHARGGQVEKGKVARVRSLATFYRQRLIWHNKAVCDALEVQLLSFPAAKKWDVMDAFGYIPEILEMGLRYMQPKQAEDYKETKEEVESEFKELENEYWPAAMGWRIL